MHQSLLVSILIPFKNASTWLEETIQSILDQSYSNWEIIAINDHSTDQSEELINSFDDVRIRVLLNDSSGIIPALQLGLSNAEGQFITRMDADDVMPPGRLNLMVSALASSAPKSIVSGKVKYFGDQPVSNGYRDYEHWLNRRVELNDHYKHIYRECVIASPNWITRKSDLLQARIFDQLVYPEDYDMTLQWYEKGFNIVAIDELTLLWREHPERTSRNSSIYDQESFFQLKVNRYLRLDGANDQSIAVLGAGPKGKITAQILDKQQRTFTWYDFNFSKYTAGIHGHSIQDYNALSEDHVLICIYPKQMDDLLNFLYAKGYEIGRNAWFF